MKRNEELLQEYLEKTKNDETSLINDIQLEIEKVRDSIEELGNFLENKIEREEKKRASEIKETKKEILIKAKKIQEEIQFGFQKIKAQELKLTENCAQLIEETAQINNNFDISNLKLRTTHTQINGNFSGYCNLIAFDRSGKNMAMAMSARKGLAIFQENDLIWRDNNFYFDVKYFDGVFWAYDFLNGKIIKKLVNEEEPIDVIKTVKRENNYSWGRIINKYPGGRFVVLMFTESLHIFELKSGNVPGAELKINRGVFGKGDFRKVLFLKNERFVLLTEDGKLILLSLKIEAGKIIYQVKKMMILEGGFGQNLTICDKEEVIFVSMGGNDFQDKSSSILVLSLVGNNFRLENSLDLTNKENFAFHSFCFYKKFADKIVICAGAGGSEGGGTGFCGKSPLNTYVYDITTKEFRHEERLDQSQMTCVYPLLKQPDGSLKAFRKDNSVISINYQI